MNKTKNIEKVNFFTTVYESVFKIEKYRVFVKQPVGKALTYLIMISLFLGIINMTPFMWGLNKKINDMCAQVQTTLPDFSITEGLLKTETQKAFSTKIDDIFNIVLDPQNTFDLKQIEVNQPLIYANKTGVSIRLTPYFFTFSYKEMLVEKSTKSDLVNYIASLKNSTPIVMVLGIIFFIIMKMLNALVLGLFVTFISRREDEAFVFPQGFKLTSYALTLPMLLEAISAITGFGGDSFSTIYHVISMIFVFYILRMMKQQDFV